MKIIPYYKEYIDTIKKYTYIHPHDEKVRHNNRWFELFRDDKY